MRTTLRRLMQRIVAPGSVQRHGLLREQQLASLQEHRDAEASLLARLETLQTQQLALAEAIEQQGKRLNHLRKTLPETIRKEALNAASQVQAYLNLQTLWHGT